MTQIGSRNHRSKLTEEQVQVIKGLLVLGYARQKIADEYGVSRKVIWNIEKGRAWTHVEGFWGI